MNRICVFCGSSMGNSLEFKQSAKKLGKYFVENKIDLVYGGANVGLMKIIADVAMEGGRKVTGIMPHLLIEKEVEHKGITELISVDTMAERKHLMAKMSDGFIAMPGGLGTLDELSEVLTYNQLRICDKPIGLLNKNFVEPVIFPFRILVCWLYVIILSYQTYKLDNLVQVTN